MEPTKKITAHLPVGLIRRARQATGKGITETLREGLEVLGQRESGRRLRALRGKVKFSVDFEALRSDDQVIAADTSVIVAYLTGEQGSDLDLLDEGLIDGTIALPPVVLVELLSDPKRRSALGPMLTGLPRLDVLPGYWIRAAATRSALLARQLRARMADTLICQSCLDHNAPLLTRDRDFRNFARHVGLKLA